MPAELLGVVRDLLEVQGIDKAVVLIDVAARVGGLAVAVESLLGGGVVGFRAGDCAVDGELQAVQRSHVGVAREGYRVADGLVGVQGVLLKRIVPGEYRTVETAELSGAVVVHLTVLVGHDVPLSVTKIDRVDRRHRVGDSEQGCAGAVIDIVRGAVGVVHVRSHLQPLLGLIVGLKADGAPLEVRVIDDALVVEVAD